MKKTKVISARACPVCLESISKVLFRQVFSSFDQGGLMDGYNLSICSRCGAAYANGIPSQSVFDRYYADMSKYERSLGGTLSAVDEDRYRQTAEMILPCLKHSDAVVDVGCATGGLLAELKRQGFTNLLGIDPSSACAAIGKRLYGIPIRTINIRQINNVTDRFDTAILTGVLEHLCDVDPSLSLVMNLLKPGGQLYIEVPDATCYYKWFSAPFQFFSMEHVNFFSPCSLSNLLARHGFSPVFVKRVKRFLSAQSVEPGIAALFKCNPGSAKKVFDRETSPCLKHYIDKSAKVEKIISKKIASLAKSRTPLAVWGAGTHTLRLLKTSCLAEANIVAFIDSNVNYQGKQLAQRPIVSPADFTDKKADILISSHVFEAEIYQTITQKKKWPNKVHRLYEGIQ